VASNSSPTSDKKRKLHLKLRGVIILAAVLVLALFWGFSRFPEAVESVYAGGLGPFIGFALARVSSIFPFSVMEVLLLLLLAWLLISLGRAVYRVVRRKQGILNALGRGALRMATVVSVLLLVFYGAWGLNYARPDLVARMGWEEEAPKAFSASPGEAGHSELARLCEELVEATNDAYARANGSTDLNRPSALPMPVSDLDAAIDAAYPRVARRLGLGNLFARSRGPAKPVAISPVMNRLLILGFYSPWTGEANYNRLMTPCRLPATMAHEKAHQRGIASEDEANFFGFMACAHCDEPYVRYSGYLFAQRTLLNELARVDRDRVQALVKQRHPGVQRDVDALRAFAQKYHGRISKAGHAVNNAYLKANRVKGGIRSYQMCARLIVAFSRVNDGTCLVTEE